ncbi:MAG: DUF6790 family protein [Patescibacteria group bacterium]|nr:DUF6790 family protein [Patescibacteria group bacterium]
MLSILWTNRRACRPAVHIREMLLSGNGSVNNAGPILVADVAFPIFLLLLVVLSKCGRQTQGNRPGEQSGIGH